MPRKVKKGGGAKTEEEKLLYLQQKAQAEEEMTKKKEEILTLFLKDKLQKEERNTVVNLLKLNEGWRSILRQTRANDLRKDIDVVRQTFERQLDGLDDVIKSLGRELEEGQRQWVQARRVHLQHVERLRAAQEKHVKELLEQRENNMENLRLSFSNERKQMLSYREQRLAKLEDAEFTLEQQHKRLMSDIIRVYSESLAAYESAHDDQMAALLLEEKATLAERSQKNQEVLVLHQEEAKELEDLVQKKQRIIQKTEEKMKTAEKLQVAAAQQQQKVKSRETENELLERDLTKAIDDVKQKTRILREKMTRGQLRGKTRLLDLTVQSNSAAKRLQSAITKGERVLRVGELCHKLSSVIAPLSWSTDDSKPETHEDRAEETSAFPELRHLTRNVNVAALHRDAAKREREHLRTENAQLRLLLRQRLDAMTISDHALDGGPGLLVVHRAPTMRTPQSTGQHRTVIEAVQVVKNSL